MHNKLNIDNYYDGYRTSDMNCVDLPIAASAGHFDRNNYFYYCLAYAYILNWNCYFDDDWFLIRSKILNSLKLTLNKIAIESENDLYGKLETCIGSGMPVFFVVKYGSLFYSQYYKFGTYNHGLIVSDFDNERRIFGIRDREVIREHINTGIFKSDVMHRIQIDYKALYKIWNDSNLLHAKEKSIHENVMYYISKITVETPPINIKKLLLYVLDENNVPIESQLEKYAYNLKIDTIRKHPISKQEDENGRRIFQRSLNTFFDVFKKYVQNDKPEMVVLSNQFNEFSQNRLNTINQLHLYSLRGILIDDCDLRLLVKRDRELFDSFKVLLLEFIIYL